MKHHHISLAFAKLNPIPTFSCVMIKKDLFENIDFNVAKKPFLDYYIWAQIAQNNEIYYLDKKLTNWRMRNESYASFKTNPIEDLNFAKQMNSINYKKNPMKRFIKNMEAYKKFCIRIHKDEILFFGRWYRLKG